MAKCIHGDCLEEMKSLPNKSIDLFVCDLPYGCLNGRNGGAYRGGGSAYSAAGCEWDVKIDLVALWREIERLCKNDHTPVIMFCNARLGAELIQSKPDWFRYDLIWNKEIGVSFLLANKQPMRSHELIYVFAKKSAFYKRIDVFKEGMPADIRPNQSRGKSRTNNLIPSAAGMGYTDYAQEENKRCPLSIIHDRHISKKSHPTGKSITLYKWLISRYSNEGDTVLDPTAGSFSSGRAAIELNRNYIGIEKDDKFYNENKIEME